MTIPDQALTVPQIMERNRRGLSIPQAKEAIYTHADNGEELVPGSELNLANMDLAEIEALKHEAAQNIVQLQLKLQDEKAAEKAAAAAAAAATTSTNAITFSSDPCTWSADKATWIVDVHGRWIALPPEEEGPVSKRLSAWLSDLEETRKWNIAWPEAEGTKAELIAALQECPTWQPAHSKLLKDELARRLGRSRAIGHLLALSR